ncbi:MAG: cytochrome bc complex cytochrome b subunit [bacterium]|nr:cytochrome bc complex cytochrome b subunit [bacterium]
MNKNRNPDKENNGAKNNGTKTNGTREKLFWSWSPKSTLDSSRATVKNFMLHWFPPQVSERSVSLRYSFWLGTMSGVLFLILCLTGLILMFHYVPTPEKAYWTMKDLDYAIPYGEFIRSTHRAAAQLMVLVVFLHLMRTFYTASYKDGLNPEAKRWKNWLLGVCLLLMTLALSFTGYLLPWDQLAVWAITVGTNIAKSVPLIGEEIRFALLGGTEVGASTLLRFYVLHCIVLPFFTLLLVVYHMWRIRKDGGLACVEQEYINVKQAEEPPGESKEKKKTYSLMGIKDNVGVAVLKSIRGETVPASPDMTRRILLVILFTLLVTTVFAILSPAPLEEPANMNSPPNPAKAPWNFLWLPELVSITTFRIGGFTVSGGLVGGVLIPGFLVALLAFWPFLDRSPAEATGVWLHKSRRRQNIVFTLIVVVIILLIIVGVYLRGPSWKFYWPWETMPHTPTYF